MNERFKLKLSEKRDIQQSVLRNWNKKEAKEATERHVNVFFSPAGFLVAIIATRLIHLRMREKERENSTNSRKYRLEMILWEETFSYLKTH